MGDFNKKESETLDFTGLKIPRDYLILQEEKFLFWHLTTESMQQGEMTAADLKARDREAISLLLQKALISVLQAAGCRSMPQETESTPTEM